MSYFNKKSEEKHQRVQAYKNNFVKSTPAKSIHGKHVTIREDYHRIIQRMVQYEEGVTIYDYLDNIISEHMANHKEDIIELYKEYQAKDPFSFDKESM